MRIESVIKQVKKYEYVSFDIFDTLVKRNIMKPTDAFKLVQLRYEKEYGINLGNFTHNRINAEISARENSKSQDITLDEIYKEFSLYNNNELEILKRIEIETEFEIICPNRWILPVYEYCKNNQKKIVIISDMYLPVHIIRDILKGIGFDYYRLYVSSDVGVTKWSGHLFNHVLNDLQINPKQIIHIGDAKRADFLSPRTIGMNSILIPRCINNLNYYNSKELNEEELFTYNTISNFINNNIPFDKTDYYRIGYETFGVLLYGFTKRLIDNLHKSGIKKVFFFSRDGYIMKKAFDIINTDNTIESNYLYVSRRSLSVPILWMHSEFDDIITYVALIKYFEVGSLLELFGLEPLKYQDALAKHNMSLKTIIYRDNIGENKNIINFYNDIKEDIVSNSKKEYDLLLKYLKSNDFEGTIAIVDIGWRGTMQRAIEEVIHTTNINADISGYYIGLNRSNDEYIRKDMNAFGYLYNSQNDIEFKNNSMIGLMETFFIAQHGSVKKYELTEGKIQPCLYKYEYINENGTYLKEILAVNDIQSGALDFINDFVNFKFKDYLNISELVASNSLFKLGIYPTKKEVKLFSDFLFFNTTLYKLASPQKIYKYLLKPKSLFFDFFNSAWKIGFVKRLMKINLPYFTYA